jgi:hypothetical protein
MTTPLDEAREAPGCRYHPDRPIRETLDGDPLCQECCNAWVRGEGEAALAKLEQADV